MTWGGASPILVRVKQMTSRSLRLVALLLVTSLLLSGVALAGLVPAALAALAASAAARELSGKAGPLGRLLARPPTRSTGRPVGGRRYWW
jgi:hypothetical protein